MATAYVDGQAVEVPDAIRNDPQALAQFLARWREMRAAQRRQEQQQQPQRQQSNSLMNPNQFLGGASMFAGGAGASSLGGSTIGAGSGGGALLASNAGAGGGGASALVGGGAGGGGGASAGAGAGPWLALAALIGANEKGGRDAGARAENPWHHARDALTGKVVEQDFQQRWLPKWFGRDRTGRGDYENDVTGFGADTHALTDFMTFDPKKAVKTITTSGSAAKLLKKIF